MTDEGGATKPARGPQQVPEGIAEPTIRPVVRPLGTASAGHGLRHAARSRAAPEAAARLTGDPPAYRYAQVCAWNNNKAGAFRWLERAVKRKDGGPIYLTRDVYVARLRDDPRHTALITKRNRPNP